jgi:hypothetical protein
MGATLTDPHFSSKPGFDRGVGRGGFFDRRSKAVITAAALAATAWLGPPAGPSNGEGAACAAGSDTCPIRLHFRSRSNRVTVHGRLSADRSRWSYSFKARAGRKLSWMFNGPSVRTLIRYPTGASDGPGLPAVIALPSTGTYVFTISSNTMAEDIFGPFQLTFQLR